MEEKDDELSSVRAVSLVGIAVGGSASATDLRLKNRSPPSNVSGISAVSKCPRVEIIESIWLRQGIALLSEAHEYECCVKSHGAILM